MASSSPLTLAALATSAVPGLEVHGYRAHRGGGAGSFHAAVISDGERELIVRVPRSSAAEALQSAEMLGLAALNEGARAELPFEVSETLGMTRAGDTRAVVSTFISGASIDTANLEDDALLLQPIAEALAAIHRLPISLVQQGGLTVRTANEARETAARVVDRADGTRLLPDTVHSRWVETLASDRLWDFAPTVAHGSFDADRLLVQDDRIVGVLGWDELSVGDPATDLAWLLGARHGVFESVVARYARERGSSGSTELQARARFHHQLDVARWLLHGVEMHNQAVIDDAVSMLDRLVDRLTKLGQPVPQRPATSPEAVERLLEELPEDPVDSRSETAEYESLDEDRSFATDDDFASDSDDAPATGGTSDDAAAKDSERD